MSELTDVFGNDAFKQWSKYPTYKSSGVEWLGDIPEHWEVKRLKYCCLITMGQSPNSDDCNLEGVGIPFLQGNAEFQEKYPIPKQFCKTPKKIAKEGDFLISVRAPVGALNIANQDYSIGRGLSSIRVNAQLIVNIFFWYSIQEFKKELEACCTGSTYEAVSISDIANIHLTLLPLSEQKAIAHFLDEKTNKIDKLIGKKKRFIELLKEKRVALISHAVTKGLNPDVAMKNSGVEWLGDIPESWEVKKLKWLVSKIGSGKTPKGGAEVYCDYGIMFLRSQNIHFDKLRLEDVVYIDNYIDQEMASTRVFPDDVLLNITGASLGRCNVIPKNFPSANVNQHVCIIRPITKLIVPKFLNLFMSSNSMQKQIFTLEDGVSREGLTFACISNLKLALPTDIQEQKEIALFLDKETEKIDQLISKTQTSIERLKEYRTALISAAVTGKIDVRRE